MTYGQQDTHPSYNRSKGHHTVGAPSPSAAWPENYYPQDTVVSQQTAERVHAPTVAVSSSSSSPIHVTRSSSPYLATTTIRTDGAGSIAATARPARTKVQLSKPFRPAPVSASSPTSIAPPSRQSIKSAPPNSRDDLEFWASLYAQHPVITQQRHEPAALSPPRTTNKKGGGPFVKIWQVLRKTHLKGEGKGEQGDYYSDRFRFETLAPEETPTTTTATKISPSTSSFSVVIFFTVEEGEQKDNNQKKFGSGSRNSKRWSLPPTLQLWCVESARNRNRMLFNQKELMGSFVPNALSFHPDSNGQDVTAPLYIYETQTLGLDAVSQEGPMVLELKLQSTEGAIYSDFFYLFVQEKEGATGVNGGKFIETTVITPRSQGMVEPRSLGTNGGSAGGNRRRQLVAGIHNNDSVGSSIGSHENELEAHHKDRGEWDMTEDEIEEEDDEEEDEKEDDFYEEKAIVVKEKKKLSNGGKGVSAGPVEPDAGEHLMQATSQFFSKMGYWLYNSRVVQYIARDERTRIKTAFQPEDIWMLGICYTLQLQLENSNSALVTSVTEEPVETEKQDYHDHTTVDGNVSVKTVSQASTLGNGDMTPSEPSQPNQSMSLTKFATTTPDHSPATSSISCHEAQSHAHSRTTITDKASDTSATTTAPNAFDQQGPVTNPLPSPAASPSTKRSSKLASRFSILNLSSESSLAKEVTRQGRSSPDAGKSDTEKNDATKTDPTPPNPRKPGKRRMTISGLFSWDSSSSESKNSAPPVPALPASSSMSALKNLVRSSSNKPQQSSGTSTSAKDHHASPQSTILMEPESLEDDDFANVEYPPELAGRQNTSGSTLRSIPERHSAQATSEAFIQEARKASQPPPSTSSLSARELEAHRDSPDAGAGSKRERRRKTGQMTMQRPTDLECTDQPHPTTQEPSSISENVSGTINSTVSSRTSHSSGSSSRRQSSMPPPTSTPTKGRPRTATSSIPSMPSASSPSLLPATTPASSNSGSSGSAIRRSWRSLSLSLASAKSALPLVSSSSFSLRSPKLPPQFNDALMRRDYGEFGTEEDYFANAFNVPGAVTLPPAVTASLALLRTSPSSATSSLTPEQATLSLFMMDFQSRLWFTYRKDLARIEPSFYTCDSGWGCMMRTGQSLLAQAFVQVLMGREWRVHHHDQPTQRRQGRRYKEIVSWFVDESERPYSIHRIAKQGLALDKRIGEWFGPSTVAHALKRLTKSHNGCPLKVIVPMDGTVRVSSVLRAASSHTSHTSASKLSSTSSSTSPSPSPDPILRPTPSQTQAWRPVLLLIPARYGLDKVTGKYLANLKQLFRMPQFLGIAGGRPNRSLYFVASQGDELFYYDPHFVKQRVTPEELGSCPMPSFHCPVVRTMHISELDPSMLLGFLIQSRDELDDLRIRLDRDMVEPSYPLLTFVDDSGSSANAL
ncbi:Cysteine protease atg4b [Linnemannia gamsii]|uniref:Autophagy-related protein 4 n=1 Tax=Linnemannia gamsii TaxID=64522 RepID=A0ABQ7JPJ8_9FUNG|nr:Cysteine protease atg4b [Linnemannia gamsii]